MTAATAGDTSFSTSLENCSGSTLKNASIKFSGQQAVADATTLSMVGSHQANDLGIQIADPRTGDTQSLNTASSGYVCALNPTPSTSRFTPYALLLLPTMLIALLIPTVSVQSTRWQPSTLPTSNARFFNARARGLTRALALNRGHINAFKSSSLFGFGGRLLAATKA